MIRTGRSYTLLWVMLLVTGFILWFNPFQDTIGSLSPKLSWHPDGPSSDDSQITDEVDEEEDEDTISDDDSDDKQLGTSLTLSPHGSTPTLTVISSATAASSSSSSSHSSSQPSHRPGLAKQLLAADLLARPLTNHSGALPRIFHQSWKTLELPGKFDAWSASCRELHADWEWVLWTDEDNLKLVQMHYPWLEEAYLALPGEIYRADLVRNLYMYTFGGVYADLDTECLAPTEKLLDQYGISHGNGGSSGHSKDTSMQVALLGRMGDDPTFKHSIPNAWMASKPAHPFFMHPVELVRRFVQNKKAKGFWDWSGYPSAETLTGPIALRDSIAEYAIGHVLNGYHLEDSVAALVEIGPWGLQDTPHELIVLPSDVIYPYSWGVDGKPVRDVCWVQKDTYNSTKCKEELKVREKGSISITYWSHTHSKTGSNQKNMNHITKAEAQRRQEQQAKKAH